jgi:hypothetical protein
MLKRKWWQTSLIWSASLAMAVILSLLAPSIGTAAAEGPVAVKIAAPGRVNINSSFIVTVNVGQVENLGGADYRLTFDPGMLAIDKVTDGKIGTDSLPVNGSKEPEPGICNIVNVIDWSNGLTGLSGSGTLAVLHMHSLSHSGSAEIKVVKGSLSSTDAKYIESTWTGSVITLAAPSGGGGGGGGGGGNAPATTTTPTTQPAVVTTPEIAATTTPAVAIITATTPAIPATQAPEPVTTSLAVNPVNTPPALAEPPPGGVAGLEDLTSNNSQPTPAASVPAEPSQPVKAFNWTLVAGSAAGLILAGLIVFMVLRKRTAR